MKLIKFTPIAFIASTFMIAGVAYAQDEAINKQTEIQSQHGNLKVITDEAGTRVEDDAGNVGYRHGGRTEADHENVVKQWSD
jgi:hypothetical protein